eukprot:gene13942-16481_t
MGEEKHLSDTADRGATDAQSDIFSDECSEYTELDEYDEYDECDEHEHKEYDECNEYEDEEAVPVGSSNVQYENLRYSPGSFDGKLSAVQEDSELLEEVAESSGAQMGEVDHEKEEDQIRLPYVDAMLPVGSRRRGKRISATEEKTTTPATSIIIEKDRMVGN